MRYEININIEIQDKDGKVIEKSNKNCNSYVRNFLVLLNAAFRVGTSDIVDTGGITCTTGAKHCVTWELWRDWGNTDYYRAIGGYGGWRATAPEGDDTYGIIVGTGDQPMITISSRRSLMATPPDSCIITQRTYMIRP